MSVLLSQGGLAMCESNVYMFRDGNEELVMEKVDRIIPGDDNIFLENVFGERRVLRARIKEMELVHHRILLDEIPEVKTVYENEIWLEPQTDHGHFHEGEEVTLKVCKGYNMKPGRAHLDAVKAMVVSEAGERPIDVTKHNGSGLISLGKESDGLIQVYVEEKGEQLSYGKLALEIGHHHHHGLQALGLALEIVPGSYSHARMGENYEIQVLKDGQPLAGVEVFATFSGTHNPDYPHRLTTNEDGKARLFLSARGNYLFKVSHDNIVSTFTLVKAF